MQTKIVWCKWIQAMPVCVLFYVRYTFCYNEIFYSYGISKSWVFYTEHIGICTILL